MLLDKIKKSENAITLSKEVEAYVENTQYNLACFAVHAFETNHQESASRNVQALCRLLHTLAFGMMVKLDVKSCGTDVVVIDLIALKTDKVILTISTTVYILLKTPRKRGS